LGKAAKQMELSIRVLVVILFWITNIKETPKLREFEYQLLKGKKGLIIPIAGIAN